MQEILVVVPLALERVAEIGVVGHEHHDARAVVEDDPRMRIRAVRAAFRCAPAAAGPEADRRNLRDLDPLVRRRLLKRAKGIELGDAGCLSPDFGARSLERVALDQAKRDRGRDEPGDDDTREEEGGEPEAERPEHGRAC